MNPVGGRQNSRPSGLLLMIPQGWEVTRKSPWCPGVGHLHASAVESESELSLKPHSSWEKGASPADL